jgi:ABC-2 type transport system permease protein
VSPLVTVRLIATREMRQRLRSKMFVWTSIGLGLILSVLAALPGLLGIFDLDRDGDVGPPLDADPMVLVVVGELSPAEVEAVTTILGPVDARSVATAAAAEEAVAADEDVDLAVVPGERIIAPSAASILDLGPDPAFAVAEALALAGWLEDAGIRDQVDSFLAVTPLEVERVGEQDPAEATARLIVANLGVVFLFAVLIMYSSMIINGVIEEKGSRVVELLIEAVPARQLMTGKVLGLGLVGLGQTLVIFGLPAIILTISAREAIPVGVGALAWLIVLWFLLGYAFYAVIAAGFGALVSRPEEAQGVLVPANVLMVTGYFIGFVAINAPDAPFARVFGWLPPTAPYVMLVRQSLGTPSLVEVLGSILLMLLAIVGATLLAARLYRGGILRIGARVRFRDAWQGTSI